MTISARTRLVFLAGDPIDHTQGYAEYAAALAAAGIDAAYLPVHVPAGQLRLFLAGLRSGRNVAGVVATVPHKLEALAAATPDAAARRAGSANVLRPGADGGWECTQVDGVGFLAAADATGIVNRADTPLLHAAELRGCRRDHGRSMMLAEIPLIVNFLFRS